MNSNDIVSSMLPITVSLPAPEIQSNGNNTDISQHNKPPACAEEDSSETVEKVEQAESNNRPQDIISMPMESGQCYVEECFDESLRIPKVNSLGKMTTFKCKKCTYVDITKVDFWKHNKVVHIPIKKQLTCELCPFVTEHKHHLTYHSRTHAGYKPFKCPQCEYSGHAKSLLNCRDSTFASKHCHPLKLHLRKYNHEPAIVLNADGSPNPSAFIDVHGKRRKRKDGNQDKEHVADHQPDGGTLTTQYQMPNQLSNAFYTMFYLQILATMRHGLFSQSCESADSSGRFTEDGVLDLSIRNKSLDNK